MIPFMEKMFCIKRRDEFPFFVRLLEEFKRGLTSRVARMREKKRRHAEELSIKILARELVLVEVVLKPQTMAHFHKHL